MVFLVQQNSEGEIRNIISSVQIKLLKGSWVMVNSYKKKNIGKETWTQCSIEIKTIFGKEDLPDLTPLVEEPASS